MKKWMFIPALAGVLVVGGVALADDSGSNPTLASKNLITLEKAKELAVQKVGGKVTEIELEKTTTGYVYDVEVKSNGIEYDLDIDATTGTVVIDKQQALTAVKQAATTTKLLTTDQAIAIALKKAQGTVTKVELDEDDGRKHYDIEIEDSKYEYEFEIDAISGEILKFEKDLDDDREKVVPTKKIATSHQGATIKTPVASTKKTMLTKNQAVAIAMQKVKGTVTDIELDDDDGQKVYEIEIEDGAYEYNFEIDAFTGKILEFEKEKQDDEDENDDD